MKLGTKILVSLSAAALALVGWAVPAALATGGGSSNNNHDWTYSAPTCTNLTVTWPKGVTGQDVKIQAFTGPGKTGQVFELLWKAQENLESVDNGTDSWNPADGAYTGTVTFEFSGHAKYPADSDFSYAWVQVDGTNYHWQGELNCGEPVDEEKFDDYTTYVCWKITADGFNVQNGRPVVSESLFPQTFVTEGNSFNELKADCWEEVTGCEAEVTTWYQLDKYKIDSKDDELLLTKLRTSGQLTWDGVGAADASIYVAHEFHKVTTGSQKECEEPEPEPEFICKWNAETDSSDKVEVDKIGIKDIPWTEGVTCAPDQATYCFADGNGGFVEATVYDDDEFPLGAPVPDAECIVEEPVYICVWDDENDKSVKTEVPAATGDDILWTDGVTCAPDEATYCFADGNGGFVEATVYDDDEFPLGAPVPDAECIVEEPVYICVWNSETSTPDMVEVPELSEGDIEWVDGAECTPDTVVICAQDGDTWFAQELYEDQLPEEYLEWTGNAEDCVDAPPVFICEWDNDLDIPVKTPVEHLNPGDVPWVDGIECEPFEEVLSTVDICVAADEDGTWERENIFEEELTEDMVLWDAELGAEGCDDDFTIVLGAPPLKAPAATPVVAVATYAG